MSNFSVTFDTSYHVNAFAVLNSYAETAAAHLGGAVFQVERQNGSATWTFESEEARDHLVYLALHIDHVRPVAPQISNQEREKKRVHGISPP